jgi:nucleotide-binding universal stress UspA family protein
MFSLAKILFPIDFSERSAAAAHCVAALASRFASEVTMLHVLPPPHYEFSALEAGGAVLNELFANRAAQVAKELDDYLAGDLKGVNLKRLLLEGDPARKIVEQAKADNAGMIVMPTHGYGSFRRFILGSVTAKVLHDAECPVWTGVHMEQPPGCPPAEIRKILCGVDLGPESGAALRWAGCMAEACGAALTAVHVIPALARSAGDRPSEFAQQLQAEAKVQLQKVIDETGVKAEMALATGDAAKAVCELASALKSDLMVISRGSAAGVFGRLRTNAYAIIRQTPCPVVSV